MCECLLRFEPRFLSTQPSCRVSLYMQWCSQGLPAKIPGGRLARPKDQIEEENEEKMRKKWEKLIEE